MKSLVEQFKREWGIMVNTSDDTTPFWIALAVLAITLISLMQ